MEVTKTSGIGSAYSDVRKKYSVNFWNAKSNYEGGTLENKYYVYEHVRKDNDMPFYVGKGSGDRAYFFTRNELHDKIANQYGWYARIIISGLTEEEAYKKEYEVIDDYINNQGFGIDIDGLRGNNPEKFLTNQTFGSRGSIGISNPMYGVTPQERMTDEKYRDWFLKTSKRLKDQVGDKNPNWHNDTLHNKLKDDPELRIQYFARRGEQNGRARAVDLFSEDGKLVKHFNFIGECAQYIIDIGKSKGSLQTVRSRIRAAFNKHEPCYGFICEIY